MNYIFTYTENDFVEAEKLLDSKMFRSKLRIILYAIILLISILLILAGKITQAISCLLFLSFSFLMVSYGFTLVAKKRITSNTGNINISISNDSITLQTQTSTSNIAKNTIEHVYINERVIVVKYGKKLTDYILIPRRLLATEEEFNQCKKLLPQT